MNLGSLLFTVCTLVCDVMVSVLWTLSCMHALVKKTPLQTCIHYSCIWFGYCGVRMCVIV